MPLTIGIAGGTCAGKTRLAEALAAHFGDALVLAMDSFYRQQPAAAIADGSADFDSPDAIDIDAMAAALAALRAGQQAGIPVYHRATSTVTGRQTATPHAVLLVEGLYVLAAPAIRSQLDLKIYIDIPQSDQTARRTLRDRDGYRRSEQRLRHDLARVAAAEVRHVLPSRAFADVILPGDGRLDDQLAACLAALG